jgi:hypothetical protein
MNENTYMYSITYCYVLLHTHMVIYIVFTSELPVPVFAASRKMPTLALPPFSRMYVHRSFKIYTHKHIHRE